MIIVSYILSSAIVPIGYPINGNFVGIQRNWIQRKYLMVQYTQLNSLSKSELWLVFVTLRMFF